MDWNKRFASTSRSRKEAELARAEAEIARQEEYASLPGQLEFERGFEAGRRGYGLSSNPYPEGMARIEWKRGNELGQRIRSQMTTDQITNDFARSLTRMIAAE